MMRLGLLLAVALLAACGHEPAGTEPEFECYDTTVPEVLWPRDKVGLPPCP